MIICTILDACKILYNLFTFSFLVNIKPHKKPHDDKKKELSTGVQN